VYLQYATKYISSLYPHQLIVWVRHKHHTSQTSPVGELKNI